jgi:4-hydroxybenzoyl-CoA thioesterase
VFTNTRKLQIEWGHCDPAGIVFNPRFFEYFDWSTVLMFEVALGMTKYDMLKKYDAVGIPIVDSRAKFLRTRRYGEQIEIASSITKFGRSSFDVHHRLLKDSELSVEAFEVRVWVVRDPANPERVKSHPIPQEVVAAFQRAG